MKSMVSGRSTAGVMLATRAYFILSDVAEGGMLRDMGIGDPYTPDEMYEAARMWQKQEESVLRMAPGRVGRAANYLLDLECRKWRG